jgi:hypothetical protein
LVRKEYYLIGFTIGIVIPLLTFVLFWWPIAALAIYHVASVPDNYIAMFAIAGLAAGIILDFLYLKRLIPFFYNFHLLIMISLYLCCSVIAVAFFMGFPLGNLLLGMLAGIYIGRRCHFKDLNRAAFTVVAKKTSRFTALVTALEALPIGLLMLQEDYLLAAINLFIGFRLFSTSLLQDIFVIVILCLILFGIQFLLTKWTATMAFRLRLNPISVR